MAAAHGGNRILYERLLGELALAIERYVRSKFGALPFTEDCVQECLLAIHRARHTYDPRRLFRPWFFSIVRNKTIDLLRRSHVHEPMDPALVFDEGSGEARVELGEILAQLKPQFRSALALTKLAGYSLSEAAERSGISQTAMKSRVRRAMRAAESLFKEER